MKIKLNIILIFLLFISFSCEYETNWDINYDSEFIVVDAIITSEIEKQEIKVDYCNGNYNSANIPLSNFNIKILWKNEVVVFNESKVQPGLYRSEVAFGAAVGPVYVLVINYGDFYDTAYAYMAPIDNMEPINISEYNDLYKINYTESKLPSMMDIYYDWSGDSVYCEQKGSCNAWETYYTLEKIDIQKEFAPEKEIIAFPENTTIIRKKYSLNQYHEDFIRSLLIETEWRGGLFDTEQGNVPSSFLHGTRGWFGVCMLLCDTTYFE